MWIYVELCGFGFIQILGPWRLAGDPKNKKKPGGVNEVNVGPRCSVPWVRPLKVWSFPQGTNSANLASANSSPVEVGVTCCHGGPYGSELNPKV